MKVEHRKGKLTINSRLFWIQLWWFPEDWARPNQGKGYWQIMGHFFHEKPFDNFWLQIIFTFGRHCGYTIVSIWVYLEFVWRWVAFSPFLELCRKVQKRETFL
jgi:hypothetical protein